MVYFVRLTVRMYHGSATVLVLHILLFPKAHLVVFLMAFPEMCNSLWEGIFYLSLFEFHWQRRTFLFDISLGFCLFCLFMTSSVFCDYLLFFFLIFFQKKVLVTVLLIFGLSIILFIGKAKWDMHQKVAIHGWFCWAQKLSMIVGQAWPIFC